MTRKLLLTSILLGVISVVFTGINITAANTVIPDTPSQHIPIPRGFPHEDKEIGVTFPAKLGDMDLVGIANYQPSGLGYSLRYCGPEWIKIDLYVYNKKLSSVPDGIYSREVKVEFLDIEKIIRIKSDRNEYGDTKKIAVGVVPKDGPVHFLWSCFEYSQLTGSGVDYKGPRISERYITGFRNHFIKFFATYWKEKEESGKKLTSDFIRDLSKILISKVEVLLLKMGVRRSVVLEEKEGCLRIYVEGGNDKWVCKESNDKTIASAEERKHRIVYVKWPTTSVREGPGINFKVLAEIQKGIALEVIEEQGQWFRVNVKGLTAVKEGSIEGWIGKATTSETP